MDLIKLNDNPDIVFGIKSVIKDNDGYCPCQPIKSEDTKCICKDFKDKIDDPNFEGECFCGLFVKKQIEEEND